MSLAQQWQAFLAAKLAPEAKLIPALLDELKLSEEDRTRIGDESLALVAAARADDVPLLESFLKEYRINEREGVALMCLAEALLRIPDPKTRDQLIKDKLGFAEWADHMGRSDNFWVNASTWGLALTGKVLKLEDGNALRQSLRKMSQPVIRQSVGRAISLLGDQFVLGETLAKARSRGAKLDDGPWLFSFDMLGEGARTQTDAERYFAAYSNAIEQLQGQRQPLVLARAGVSVKLSALYPRFEFSHAEAALQHLWEKLLPLAQLAARCRIPLTVDAEESHRQMLTLLLVEKLLREPSLAEWQGLGLAVQAYSKSALATIDWLITLARETGRQLGVRLVKGAYWDSEIKLAQEQGLSDFPVFSRKCNTDLSYLVCAQRLLAARPLIYPAFATHNANTLAAIRHIANRDADGYEFQRLHGMGESVYRQARHRWQDLAPVRVYAPVGSHKDLLAYLVRRLIENGANSSFVNQLSDAAIPVAVLAQDAVAAAANSTDYRHPQLVWPDQVFGERANARGLDLTDATVWQQVAAALDKAYRQQHRVTPLVAGFTTGDHAPSQPIINPADSRDHLGQVVWADAAVVDKAFHAAVQHWPGWRDLPVAKRADCLLRVADKLESDTATWLPLLVREAGKTWGDAVSEIREAVDFCRYYAAQANREFGQPELLPEHGPGIAGEANRLHWQGRGVFVCISPWNFPLAIFLGQVAAALVAGNAVIAKPAQQTNLIAFEAVRLLHQCGVPESILAFLPGGRELGAAIVADLRVAGVAFTGSVAAAQAINRSLAAKDGPIVPLIAETGGQNVMIADSSALLEQLSDDVMRSAFASAGQRCSALRVLYLQEDIYGKALTMIKGAMEQQVVADPKQLASDIGPIIDGEALAKLQAYIERQKNQAKAYYTPQKTVPEQGHYLAPHLFEIDRIDQIPGEQFGPILHVIAYAEKDLENIIAEACSTGFGLTFGIHSRIESRAQLIAERIPVGNVYINRNMIGAVVGLQPFGGMGLSGTGFKAGGKHYLYRFATEKSISVNTVAVGGNAQLLNLRDE